MWRVGVVVWVKWGRPAEPGRGGATPRTETGEQLTELRFPPKVKAAAHPLRVAAAEHIGNPLRNLGLVVS